MLKLYEKSHIKHLPGYGRVWYGFCLDVKGFNAVSYTHLTLPTKA